MAKNTTRPKKQEIEPKIEVLESRVIRDSKNEYVTPWYLFPFSLLERLHPDFVCIKCNSGDMRQITSIQKIKKTYKDESGELKTQIYENKENIGYFCGKCGLESKNLTEVFKCTSLDTGDYGTGAFGF